MNKYMQLLVVAMVSVVLIMSACQSSTLTTSLPTDNAPDAPTPTEPVQPVPETTQVFPTTDASPTLDAYPPPGAAAPVYNPYPGPSEGASDFLEWSQAEALILKGEVTEIYQNHNLHVTLVLNDGRIILVLEPEIDAVFEVVERCGGLCKDVIHATE